MTNNDILRRLRYTFELNDSKMMRLFKLGGLTVSRAKMSDWLKKEEDEAFVRCNDKQLSTFLNGFIIDKRGKKSEDTPVPELRLTNNMIFRKLNIALNLKAEDVLTVLNAADFSLSKHELSAFFRKPGHKHFRECKDQVLRRFLKGLQEQHRGQAEETP